MSLCRRLYSSRSERRSRYNVIARGVNNFFKTLAKNVHSQSQKTTGPIIEVVCERKKPSPDWRVKFVFLLTNPVFYSHMASWRVVIRTPGMKRHRYLQA
jgi:hypothetical protein